MLLQSVREPCGSIPYLSLVIETLVKIYISALTALHPISTFPLSSVLSAGVKVFVLLILPSVRKWENIKWGGKKSIVLGNHIIKLCFPALSEESGVILH